SSASPTRWIGPPGRASSGSTRPPWPVTCDRLGQIRRPTLVVTESDDQATPPANSLLLAERIPQTWLASFAGGGHRVSCHAHSPAGGEPVRKPLDRAC